MALLCNNSVTAIRSYSRDLNTNDVEQIQYTVSVDTAQLFHTKSACIQTNLTTDSVYQSYSKQRFYMESTSILCWYERAEQRAKFAIRISTGSRVASLRLRPLQANETISVQVKNCLLWGLTKTRRWRAWEKKRFCSILIFSFINTVNFPISHICKFALATFIVALLALRVEIPAFALTDQLRSELSREKRLRFQTLCTQLFAMKALGRDFCKDRSAVTQIRHCLCHLAYYRFMWVFWAVIRRQTHFRINRSLNTTTSAVCAYIACSLMWAHSICIATLPTVHII